MKELSLFSGCGGGLIASKYYLNWKTLGYVEYEKYPQEQIAQRIKDGLLENSPIFGDIREFIDQGYARIYKGMVDIISAGFPCQPFSVAGKQQGQKDKRDMWPSTCETIGIIKPKYAYLENVSGLLSAHEARCPECNIRTEWFNKSENYTEFKGFAYCPTCLKRVDRVTARIIYYFGRILRGLSEIGYDARWQTLSAKETGACHKRDRLWILAHAKGS